MAKKKGKKVNWKDVSLRGTIRAMVKSGKQDRTIQREVKEKYSGTHQSTIDRVLREERKNKRNIDRVNKYDKRKKANVPELLGCPDGSTVIARISVELWSIEEKRYKSFDTSIVLNNTGRMGDILKDAVGKVLEHQQNVAEGKYRSTSYNRLVGSKQSRVTIESLNCNP